jgi:hypothetical protein
MSDWYSVSLGDGITAAAPSAEIEELFQRSHTAALVAPNMAVFTRLESEGRLYCEVIAYFSPAAHDVAEAFDAQPCERPERAGLRLLVGDERAWSVLFPEDVV